LVGVSYWTLGQFIDISESLLINNFEQLILFFKRTVRSVHSIRYIQSSGAAHPVSVTVIFKHWRKIWHSSCSRVKFGYGCFKIWEL